MAQIRGWKIKQVPTRLCKISVPCLLNLNHHKSPAAILSCVTVVVLSNIFNMGKVCAVLCVGCPDGCLLVCRLRTPNSVFYVCMVMRRPPSLILIQAPLACDRSYLNESNVEYMLLSTYGDGNSDVSRMSLFLCVQRVLVGGTPLLEIVLRMSILTSERFRLFV